MLRVLAAAVGGVLFWGQAAFPVFAADTWPSRPLKFIVPFTAGGSTDITARVLADGLRPVLGQTVLIENRPGASGNIAGDAVAKAAPDGYTFLVSSATLLANMHLYKSPPYDYVRDLAPVSQTYFSTNVLVVRPNLPVANLAQFIAYVKSDQNPVNYGTAGHGSSQHLAAALFNNMVGGNMAHVPYKGGAPAATALLAGEIQTVFAPLIEVLPHIRAGALKPLGVCGKRRSSLLPDVPVISDFLPGFEMTSWNGILAPAKTPADIVNRLSEALVKVLNQPGVKAHFAESDKDPVGSSPAEFKQFIAAEVERTRMQVRISGAKMD